MSGNVPWLGTVLILVCCAVWASVDLPRHLHLTSSMTASGAATALLAGLAVLVLLLSRRASRAAITVTAPLALLLAVELALTLTVGVYTTFTLQNTVVYLLAIAVLLVSSQPRNSRELEVTTRALLGCFGFAAVVYLVTAAFAGLGNSAGISSRSYAAFAVTGVAVALSMRRVDPRLAYALLVLQIAALCVSLSRTALAAALALGFLSILVEAIKRRSIGRVVGLVAGSAFLLSVLWIAASNVPRLHSRLFRGDHALTIGGITIDSEGRSNFWPLEWNTFRHRPVLGHGIGASSSLILRHFPPTDQPHNDYLRILVDGGLLALIVIVAAGVVLFARLFKQWWQPADATVARPAEAAALAIAGLALLMITDNPIVYPFVVGPVAVVIGLALTDARPQDPASSEFTEAVSQMPAGFVATARGPVAPKAPS